MNRQRIAVVALAALLAGSLAGSAGGTQVRTRYLVVLAGQETADGFQPAGSAAAVQALLASAGGTLANDLRSQIGVVVAESPNPAFADLLRASPLVADAAEDWRWQGLPDASEVAVATAAPPPGGAEQTADPLEPLQWDMDQIDAPEAHGVQAGSRAVDVGILDSGIDGHHPDFLVDGAGSNVDCARGRNSVTFLPAGPGVGTPDPCVDNQFHGTHVAGTVAAQANGIGVVGVAPNATLVPVKVCDASGYCYASAVVDGITYAGDIRLDVVNMSFFVDDDAFQESTEFKCSTDPVQRSFRRAVERALRYAQKRGVAPVAALGNSDQDLANPVDDNGQPISNECEVVPAETEGVIGTMALGAQSEKAGYSNYGAGETDVAAPGGNGTTGDCTTTILSTLPGGGYGCIQGTSMASPHAAGVAALIVSQFGRLRSNGDVELAPSKVEEILESTAVDIGLAGYDECFGNGRINALRAVRRDTTGAIDASAPHCAEYAE
jgi:lantibiotic leader peptide-processing serine protease